VSRRLRSVIRLHGWDGTTTDRATMTVRASAARWAWTPYPGGFVYTGRHCLSLQVTGPGDSHDRAVFGLGEDCS
jgi:hypothetical protein